MKAARRTSCLGGVRVAIALIAIVKGRSKPRAIYVMTDSGDGFVPEKEACRTWKNEASTLARQRVLKTRPVVPTVA